MEERIADLYKLPNISDYEDVALLTLREECSALEQNVQDILYRLSDNDRRIIEAYIDARNELEFQSVKTALRLGKAYCK